MEQYQELIQKLVDGEIEEIKVERENVMFFIAAWREREDRKYIVGEAAHLGNVTYRYDQTVL